MASDAGVRNIDDLAAFGRDLKKLGETMVNVMLQAQRRMNQVSEGWQDKNNDKFKMQMDQDVRVIKKMSEEFSNHSEYIKKITEVLKQYQTIR